jgi:hypothetical protein
VVFGWSPTPQFAHESAPDFYHFQISSDIGFGGNLLDTLVRVDTLSVDRSVFSVGDTLYWRVQGLDSAGWSSAIGLSHEFRASVYACGDMDLSGTPDISDVTQLIGFLFLGGPPPVPAGSGSVDCDEGMDISDLTFLIGYLFLGGSELCCF